MIDWQEQRAMSEALSHRQSSAQKPVSGERPLLHDLARRTNNDLAAAIAIVSLTAARCSSEDVRGALAAVEERLQNCVLVHDLQVPPPGVLVDVSVPLRQLCQSISRAKLDCRGIKLHLAEHPLELDSERCLGLCMILAELIAASSRHRFGDDGGKICIELAQRGPFVSCCVTDNATAPACVRPGEDAGIVESLVASLGGVIQQHFGTGGGMSILGIPMSHTI